MIKLQPMPQGFLDDDLSHQVQKGINAVIFPKKLKGDVEALVQSSASPAPVSSTFSAVKTQLVTMLRVSQVKGLCNSNPTERLAMKKGGLRAEGCVG